MLQCLFFYLIFWLINVLKVAMRKWLGYDVWIWWDLEGTECAACSHSTPIRPIPSLVVNRTHIKILQNHLVFSSHWPRTANQIAPDNNSITSGNLTLNKIWDKNLTRSTPVYDNFLYRRKRWSNTTIPIKMFICCKWKTTCFGPYWPSSGFLLN
jgi:hypothetical protein